MRFFILVTLIVGIVVALFYLVILPEFLLAKPQTQPRDPKTESNTTLPQTNKNSDENQVYKEAKKGGIRECRDFLEQFPDSDYAPEIKQKLDKLISIGISKIPEPGPQDLESEKDYPETWTNPIDDSEMILIKAGTFIRGSNLNRNRGVEKPEMKIYVSSFYIDKYAITRKQFKKFIDADGYKIAELWSHEGLRYIRENNITEPAYWKDYVGPSLPVVGISWYEAEAYCRWSKKWLPSEVQWEKAARGYYGQKYPWGNEWIADACNWRDKNPLNPDDSRLGFQDGTADLAETFRYAKYASPFGVVQMSGNTWEWVIDQWSPSFFKDIEDEPARLSNPVNSTINNLRVLKGGSFDLDDKHCEPSWRHGDYPSRRQARTYGFRCMKKAEIVYKDYKASLQPDDSPEEDD